jgi:hypothetical protein
MSDHGANVEASSHRDVSPLVSGIVSIVLATAVIPSLTSNRGTSAYDISDITERGISTPLTVQREKPSIKVEGFTTYSSRVETFGQHQSWVQSIGLNADVRLEEQKLVLQELNNLRDLPEGWKGHDSIPVPEAAIEQALTLLNTFFRELPSGPIPSAGATEDGEIILTWYDGSLIGNLSVRGNGYYSFYFSRDENNDYVACKGARIPIGDPVPQHLVHFLSA